ncbi:MAG: class I SAM-dependent methyltransferase [Pikeienuella sp.]
MTSNTAAAGQVSKSAAEIYDEFFVPALFGEWAGRLCDAADVGSGMDVLDIACGTGATTREIASRVGPNGTVTGIDCNDGMLTVARSRAPDISWIEGQAESLPFSDDSFDRVLCQFGLMFFEDRVKSLQQMQRVLRPGGQIALTTWDDVTNSPGYEAMINLIDSLFGPEPANALRAPYVLGDSKGLEYLLTVGGLNDATVSTITGTAQFASIREWVRLDVRGWTLTDYIDDAGFEALVAAAEEKLGHFTTKDGSVTFPAPAHIAVWQQG